MRYVENRQLDLAFSYLLIFIKKYPRYKGTPIDDGFEFVFTDPKTKPKKTELKLLPVAEPEPKRQVRYWHPDFEVDGEKWYFSPESKD